MLVLARGSLCTSDTGSGAGLTSRNNSFAVTRCVSGMGRIDKEGKCMLNQEIGSSVDNDKRINRNYQNC